MTEGKESNGIYESKLESIFIFLAFAIVCVIAGLTIMYILIQVEIKPVKKSKSTSSVRKKDQKKKKASGNRQIDLNVMDME